MDDAVICDSLTSSTWTPKLKIKAAPGTRGWYWTQAYNNWIPNNNNNNSIPNKTTAGDGAKLTFLPLSTKLERSWGGGDNRNTDPLYQTSSKQPKGIAKTFFCLDNILKVGILLCFTQFRKFKNITYRKEENKGNRPVTVVSN